MSEKEHDPKIKPYLFLIVLQSLISIMMRTMGKLITPFNHKKDTSVQVASVRLANTAKGYLAKVSAEEIKARRVAAYRYLLP